MTSSIKSVNSPRTTLQDSITVCALYKFVTLADFEQMRAPMREKLTDLKIRGTLLLANEGINGTISGTNDNINEFIDWLRSDSRLSDLDYKLSFHDTQPFNRIKVKLKKEIVTMGIDSVDPNKVVGTYVDPKDWNDVISDPDTILIDTRNEYEFGIGTFKNAVNPHTETFREFPEYIEKNLDPGKHKKVAMFCTGGIRCEKASAYMKEQGFEEVYHLKGGILKYLEEVEPEKTLWDGECFVFDDRVAVNHNLERGQYDQCHACRYPITEQDKESIHYIAGVSCPRCYESISEERKARFEEREKQIQLARQRGEQHIGLDSRLIAEKNRREKQAEKDAQRNKHSSKRSTS